MSSRPTDNFLNMCFIVGLCFEISFEYQNGTSRTTSQNRIPVSDNSLIQFNLVFILKKKKIVNLEHPNVDT